MSPKIVRSLIYSITALAIFFVVWNKAGTSGPASGGNPIEPLIPTGETFDPSIEFHNIINASPYSPVVIFSKSYCPHSKRAKTILMEHHTLNPAPKIIELDQHPHGAELQAEIHRQTGRRTVPNVLVAKVSRGGGDDMAALDDSGLLKKKFEEWAGSYLKVD